MNNLITTIIAILSILQAYNTLNISSNPIYEIVSNSNFQKCYTCEEDCSQPTLTNCARTSKCFSKTLTNGIIKSKGCVDLNTDICANGNEDSTCYTCGGDFCNADIPTTQDEDLGVSKCYVCIDECADPPAQHDCKEVLEEKEGKPVKAACLQYEVRSEDTVTISKGCVPDNNVTRQTCQLTNAVYEGVTCSMCSTDLCNGKGEESEKYVDECYHCEGACTNPTKQNCKAALGENAKSKCIAVEITDDQGITVYDRRCVEVNSTVLAICSVVNQQGGNCTICDTNLCNWTSSGEMLYYSLFVVLLTFVVPKYV